MLTNEETKGQSEDFLSHTNLISKTKLFVMVNNISANTNKLTEKKNGNQFLPTPY